MTCVAGIDRLRFRVSWKAWPPRAGLASIMRRCISREAFGGGVMAVLLDGGGGEEAGVALTDARRV